MRIISRRTLKIFWERHPDAQQALLAWYADVKQAVWNSPNDIKQVYRTASFVGNERVVFNIKGNKYRLIVAINYGLKIVFIRFVGTHAEYDEVAVATI